MSVCLSLAEPHEHAQPTTTHVPLLISRMTSTGLFTEICEPASRVEWRLARTPKVKRFGPTLEVSPWGLWAAWWMSGKRWFGNGWWVQALSTGCGVGLRSLCSQTSIHSFQRFKLSARELIPHSRQAGLCPSAQISCHHPPLVREPQSGELDHPSHRQASELQPRSISHIPPGQKLLMLKGTIVWFFRP